MRRICSLRATGRLIPPLQGPFGVGDLGPEAYAFVDWLHEAGMQACHQSTRRGAHC